MRNTFIPYGDQPVTSHFKNNFRYRDVPKEIPTCGVKMCLQG